jgi:hypothetical protein
MVRIDSVVWIHPATAAVNGERSKAQQREVLVPQCQGAEFIYQ